MMSAETIAHKEVIHGSKSTMEVIIYLQKYRSDILPEGKWTVSEEALVYSRKGDSGLWKGKCVSFYK